MEFVTRRRPTRVVSTCQLRRRRLGPVDGGLAGDGKTQKGQEGEDPAAAVEAGVRPGEERVVEVMTRAVDRPVELAIEEQVLRRAPGPDPLTDWLAPQNALEAARHIQLVAQVWSHHRCVCGSKIQAAMGLQLECCHVVHNNEEQYADARSRERASRHGAHLSSVVEIGGRPMARRSSFNSRSRFGIFAFRTTPGVGMPPPNRRRSSNVLARRNSTVAYFPAGSARAPIVGLT